MPITDQQAIQAILTPARTKQLKRASLDNDRQRFHAVPATDEADAGPYVTTFLAWIKGILNNEEKFDRFKSLLRYPLPSARLLDKAADEYLKAFGAEDRYVDYNFSDDDIKADATEFLDEIKFDDFISKNLFNQCLRSSTAIWIVDLPVEPNIEGYPSPTPILREARQITDIGTDTRGNVTSVIYPLSDLLDNTGASIAKRWAVLDDASFRVLIQHNGESQPNVFTQNPHQLNRCPAGWIWHDRLDENQPIRIQSPLHALFTDLDLYVAGSIFRQHADLYASFPILWSFKSRCDYQIGDEVCTDGLVVTGRGTEEEKVQACPKCAKAKPIGPGSHIRVPRPIDRESADLSNPAGFINAERDLLDYNAEKLKAMEADLIDALTGDDGTVDQSTNAVNMDQVQARFEKRKAILSYWASHLEQTNQELLWVMLALRYGPVFDDCTVSYGTEFHLLSPGQAILDYQAARDANLPMYQLAVRRTRIDKLLAGASESQALRFFMLSQLEPYPDLPLLNVPIGSDAWELKANFSQYITQFERENIDITAFGIALDMGTRISNILNTLYSYVSTSKARRAVPEPESAGPESGTKD